MAASRPEGLPDFGKPPVVETVLGIQFDELTVLGTVHAGLLWNEFRDHFPLVSEHPPLDSVFETFGGQLQSEAKLTVQLMKHGPFPRLWFMNTEQTELIQFQRDRLIHNWRKIKREAEYPRYEAIKPRFLDEVEILKRFLASHGLGEIRPNQCEISYVNHIIAESGEDFRGQLLRAFTGWQFDTYPQLGPVEDATFSMRFLIKPSIGREPIGRVIVSAEPRRTQDGKSLIVLTLTARGRPEQANLAAASEFLDIGRKLIVDGFTAITSSEMHREWQRVQ